LAETLYEAIARAGVISPATEGRIVPKSP